MSHQDKYKYDNEHYERKENILGEMLGEVPFVGELFESLGQARIGKKGAKKLFCCCAPVVIILLIPLIMLLYWLAKSALSLFKIDITNIGWLEQGKNLLGDIIPIDQAAQWFGNIGNLLSNFSN